MRTQIDRINKVAKMVGKRGQMEEEAMEDYSAKDIVEISIGHVSSAIHDLEQKMLNYFEELTYDNSEVDETDAANSCWDLLNTLKKTLQDLDGELSSLGTNFPA